MAETYVDDGGVEDIDAGAYEQERPDNRDQRYEREPDEGEQDERPQRREPSRDQAEGRRARELREERQRRRELEARLERLESQRAKPDADADPFDDLLNVDVDADPIGGVAAAQRLARALKEEREQGRKSQEAQEANTRRVTALANWADSHIEDFKETHADFDDAISHLQTAMIKDAKAAGKTDVEAAQKFAKDILDLIETAKERGKDPAAAMYAIAQRNGYKLDKEGDQVQQRPQGQRGVSPFAGTGTRSGSGGVTVRSVAEAPKSALKAIRSGDDDFDKGFSRLKAAAKGGRR